MHQIEIDDGDNDDSAADDYDEAVGFSIEVHVEYIRKKIEYYKGIAYDKWIMCQKADNARVNGKTSELLRIPRVPCKNHILNPKVNSMVASTPDLHKKLRQFKPQ